MVKKQTAPVEKKDSSSAIVSAPNESERSWPPQKDGSGIKGKTLQAEEKKIFVGHKLRAK
jgi:hypothetical protein